MLVKLTPSMSKLVDSDPRSREWFPFNVYSTQRQKQVRQNNEVTQLTLIQV